MKKVGIAAMVAATMLMVLAVAASATPETHKVDICHRTDSATNPYVLINVDADSVDLDTGNDHGQGDHNAEHRGPIATSEVVAQALKDAHIEWGDIIPPFFDDGSPGTWPSLNWTTEGQAIFNNGCNFATVTTTTVVPPPVTTSTTVVPPPVTTSTTVVPPPVTTTTSSAPPPVTTTTSVVPPPVTTTSVVPPPPPTTTSSAPPPPPPTTSQPPPPPTTTTTAPPPPPTHTNPPPNNNPPNPNRHAQPLAFTGGPQPWMWFAAAFLFLLGVTAYLRGRAVERD